ncbi:hypothetical protein L596_009569 [Steinernema carpocapsae]|uniref:Uncharacterized protein n=1 Tax=Steinernema carpocapsae TaxID=34508 RepID=A0A4U5PH18_STECR|nr:hypothetical protein L596_009569 [Steinernema carpocapsae]
MTQTALMLMWVVLISQHAITSAYSRHYKFYTQLDVSSNTAEGVIKCGLEVEADVTLEKWNRSVSCIAVTALQTKSVNERCEMEPTDADEVHWFNYERSACFEHFEGHVGRVYFHGYDSKVARNFKRIVISSLQTIYNPVRGRYTLWSEQVEEVSLCATAYPKAKSSLIVTNTFKESTEGRCVAWYDARKTNGRLVLTKSMQDCAGQSDSKLENTKKCGSPVMKQVLQSQMIESATTSSTKLITLDGTEIILKIDTSTFLDLINYTEHKEKTIGFDDLSSQKSIFIEKSIYGWMTSEAGLKMVFRAVRENSFSSSLRIRLLDPTNREWRTWLTIENSTSPFECPKETDASEVGGTFFDM